MSTSILPHDLISPIFVQLDLSQLVAVDKETELSSTDVQEAIHSTRFCELAKHAEGTDVLADAMCNIKTDDIATCISQILCENWNHPIFADKNTGTILIYLYITDKITMDQYTNLAMIHNFFQQFSELLPDGKDIIPCLNRRVVDLNSLTNQDQTIQFNELQKSYAPYCLRFEDYMRKHPEDKCQFMIVQLNKTENENLIKNRTGIDSLNNKLLKPFVLMNMFIRTKKGIIMHDIRNNTLYMPTVELLNKLLAHHEHALTMEPFLGTTTAENLKVYREKNIHPIAIFHPSVTNNFNFPHHQHGSRLISGIHDLFHVMSLSCYPKELRKLMLDMDTATQYLKHYHCPSLKRDRFGNSVTDPLSFSNFIPQRFLSSMLSINALLPDEFKVNLQETTDNKAEKTRIFHNIAQCDQMRIFLDQDIDYPVEISSAFLLLQAIHTQFIKGKCKIKFLLLNYIMFYLSKNHQDSFGLLNDVIVSESIRERTDHEKLLVTCYSFWKSQQR